MVRLARDIIRQKQEARDPALRIQRYLHEKALANAETIKKLDLYKGEPGAKPVRGVDYFTPGDIEYMVEMVRSRVRSGIDGKPGRNGMPGKDGTNARTPVVGVDYYTAQEKKALIKEIVASIEIPRAQDGVSPDPEAIAERVVELVLEKKRLGLRHISDVDKLVDFLKIGGFRGGGPSLKAGTNITITQNTDGTTTLSATAGNPNVATESLTGTQSGSNVTLDLTGLSHTFSAIQFVTRNTQILPNGLSTVGESTWQRSGNTITVYNADAGDYFLVNYTYA